MKNLFTILSILFLTAGFASGQQKTALEGQDTEFLLFTSIDTSQLNKYNHLFDFETFNNERLLEFRNYIKPYACNGDALGEFLYARTFDLYPYGMGDSVSADTAMVYYINAAGENWAMAEFFLYKVYMAGYMNISPDMSKALEYLERSIDHGDSLRKATGYNEFAYLWYNGNIPGFDADIQQAAEMLELSLSFNPNDGRVTDFLAAVYEESGIYDRALELYLKSDNDLSLFRAARWLIEGKVVKKDINRGLTIIYKTAEKLIDSGADMNGYMGDTDPVYLLNKLYHCDRIITKKQCGKYFQKDFICD